MIFSPCESRGAVPHATNADSHDHPGRIFVTSGLAGQPKAASQPPEKSTAKPSGEVMDDSYETPPPRTTVPGDACQAGPRAGDSRRHRAGLLRRGGNQCHGIECISEADWLAHESAAYFDFSAEFRDSCDDLVHHSQAKNVKALVQDYGTLTTTCVACHEYLCKERQTKDMPGRVSSR